jgi:sugar (pentulose or hexulose) kinase
MSQQESGTYMVLDIGSSLIKCGCIDHEDHLIVRHEREFPMVHERNSYEIDFKHFFRVVSDLLKETLQNRLIRQSGVKALLITSQAQTFVAVDETFSPLHRGIVWLDERAEVEAALLKDYLPGFIESAGFAAPLSSMYLSKLLWLKKHEPELFDVARAFPLINEYLAFKLTGEFYSDSTGFGMGGLYDLRDNSLNDKLLKLLDLEKGHFPEVDHATAKGVMISPQIMQEWKLDYQFPVFLCGNDQSASAVGAGLRQPGDLNINFGSAMVLYTVTASLTSHVSVGEIAGKHPVGDDFFLLIFESNFGLQMRSMKESFFPLETYDRLYQTFMNYPEVRALDPLSIPDNLDKASKQEIDRVCAGIIQHYLSRLKEYLARMQRLHRLNRVFISGGMSKSEVWLDILSKHFALPLVVNNRADAGLFGARDIYLQNSE